MVKRALCHLPELWLWLPNLHKRGMGSPTRQHVAGPHCTDKVTSASIWLLSGILEEVDQMCRVRQALGRNSKTHQQKG